MHYLTELVHVEPDRFVLQRILVFPIDMSDGGGVVMDFQSVRSQIQYPLDRTAAASHHETVHHFPHSLETAAVVAASPVPASWLAAVVTLAAVTLIPTVLEITRAATWAQQRVALR